MPSNIIQINGSKELTWIVPDSKMEEIIKKLNKCGDKDSSDEITVPEWIDEHNAAIERG